MRAITLPAFGGPEVLTLATVPEPVLRPDDLLVRVRAAGVNRADLNQRKGAYGAEHFGDSDLMGLEIAGEVIGFGAAAQGFAPGDRVMGIVGGGAYAEIARLPAAMAIPVPADLGFVEAAAIPEGYVTAHETLFHLGGLDASKSVLVHGGAGGIGTAAVMLARQAGAKVITTVRAAMMARVVALGADHALDYAEDFLEPVMALTAGRGVDVIVDTIGSPTFTRNITALAECGRLIQIGLMGGREPPQLPIDRIMFRRLSIIGSVMKSRSAAEKAAMVHRFHTHWGPALAAGKIVPPIAATFPLADAARAHTMMEAGGHLGKIVLVP